MRFSPDTIETKIASSSKERWARNDGDVVPSQVDVNSEASVIARTVGTKQPLLREAY